MYRKPSTHTAERANANADGNTLAGILDSSRTCTDIDDTRARRCWAALLVPLRRHTLLWRKLIGNSSANGVRDRRGFKWLFIFNGHPRARGLNYPTLEKIYTVQKRILYSVCQKKSRSSIRCSMHVDPILFICLFIFP